MNLRFDRRVALLLGVLYGIGALVALFYTLFSNADARIYPAIIACIAASVALVLGALYPRISLIETGRASNTLVTHLPGEEC